MHVGPESVHECSFCMWPCLHCIITSRELKNSDPTPVLFFIFSLKAQHYVIADCTPNRHFRSTRFGIGSNWGKSKWSTLIWSWRKEFNLLSLYAPPRAPHRKWKFVRRQINTVALNSRSSQSMHIYVYIHKQIGLSADHLVVIYVYIYTCVYLRATYFQIGFGRADRFAPCQLDGQWYLLCQ